MSHKARKAPRECVKRGADAPLSDIQGPAFDLLQKNTITAIPAFCVRDGRAYYQGWLPLSGLFLFWSSKRALYFKLI